MSGVKTIRRLAKNILNCGLNKVWLDPNEREKIGAAQTREQIRGLIAENLIIKKPDNTNSRGRARARAEAKNKGRHMGLGKRKGTRDARLPKRTIWMKTIRSMRSVLKEMRVKGELNVEEYHKYKRQAKGNMFKNKNIMVDNILKKKAEAERIRELEAQAKALEMNKSN